MLSCCRVNTRSPDTRLWRKTVFLRGWKIRCPKYFQPFCITNQNIIRRRLFIIIIPLYLKIVFSLYKIILLRYKLEGENPLEIMRGSDSQTMLRNCFFRASFVRKYHNKFNNITIIDRNIIFRQLKNKFTREKINNKWIIINNN